MEGAVWPGINITNSISILLTATNSAINSIVLLPASNSILNTVSTRRK